MKVLSLCCTALLCCLYRRWDDGRPKSAKARDGKGAYDWIAGLFDGARRSAAHARDHLARFIAVRVRVPAGLPKQRKHRAPWECRIPHWCWRCWRCSAEQLLLAARVQRPHMIASDVPRIAGCLPCTDKKRACLPACLAFPGSLLPAAVGVW